MTPADPLTDSLVDASVAGALYARIQRERRAAVGAQLALLPTPVNEYKIVMPQAEKNAMNVISEVEKDASGMRDEDGSVPVETDAADVAELEQTNAVAKREAMLASCSSAMRRELPRPLVINRAPTLLDSAAPHAGDSRATAAQLLDAEVLRLLEADASADQPSGAPERVNNLCWTNSVPLGRARSLLRNESKRIASALTISGDNNDYFQWSSTEQRLAYVPSLQMYADRCSTGEDDRMAASEQQQLLLKNLMARDAKRAGKVEKKLETLSGGYRKRALGLERKCSGLLQGLLDKLIDMRSLKSLDSLETHAKSQRLATVRAQLSYQSDREAELQNAYAALLRDD